MINAFYFISKTAAKTEFSQENGCINGEHIPIKQPDENNHTNYCYKTRYSLNFQLICDKMVKFVDVEVKWPGSVHDVKIVKYQVMLINKF